MSDTITLTANQQAAVKEAQWLANLAFENFCRQPISKTHLERPEAVLDDMVFYHRKSGDWIVMRDEEFRAAFNEEITRMSRVLHDRAQTIYRELGHLASLKEDR
jgi:hypothetical protein